MSDIESGLAQNANKSIDLLHRSLMLWFTLCLITVYLPETEASAQIALSISEIAIPIDSVRSVGATAIFLLSIVFMLLLSHHRKICNRLAETNYIKILLTYPSIATIGSKNMRGSLFIGLAFIQYFVGVSVFAGIPEFLGDGTIYGVCFAFCSPLLFLSSCQYLEKERHDA